MNGRRDTRVLFLGALLAAACGFAQTTSSQSAKVAVSAGAQTAKFGQAVTLRAKSADGRRGQRVTFMDGAAVLGTASFNEQGEAALSTSVLSIGAHSIRAVPSGGH